MARSRSESESSSSSSSSESSVSSSSSSSSDVVVKKDVDSKEKVSDSKKAGKRRVEVDSAEEEQAEREIEASREKKKKKVQKSSSSSSSSESESEGKDEAESDGESEGDLEAFSVYVEGLPFDLDENDVWNLFSKYGEVVDLRLPKWQDSGRLRGNGWVDFATEAELLETIEKLNGHRMKGRYLTVAKANARRQAQAPATTRTKDIPKNCVTLFVKQLPYDTSEEIVEEAFASFGKVRNVRLSRAFGRLKGFGYIEFDSNEGVKAAMKCKSPIMVQDRAVVIDVEVGRPKASFRDSSGRQWNKTEGRTLREEKHGSRGGRGRGRGGGRGRGSFGGGRDRR